MTVRETLLAWHLRSNLDQPVSPDFVPAAMAALDALQAGDLHCPIDMPDGTGKPAYEVMNDLCLWHFFLPDKEQQA